MSTFCPYDEIILLNEEKPAQKPEEFQKKLYYYRDRRVESRKILMKSSLKLGYGMDLVTGYNNYECGREYSAWLRNGMDPFRALKAATSVNADILGIGDRTGTIEPGKLADLAGWGRDLLNDDLALLDCSFVMKEGTVYPTISIIGK